MNYEIVTLLLYRKQHCLRSVWSNRRLQPRLGPLNVIILRDKHALDFPGR